MNDHLSERADKIRQLNDQFRMRLKGSGKVIFVGELAAKEFEHRDKVFQAVMKFEAFNQGDDPYGEHDFGAFDLDGERYMFKIDYYDPSMDAGSDDPADPTKTLRVMSIFYASDY